MITIEVGGTIFKTNRSTLANIPSSLLGQIAYSCNSDDETPGSTGNKACYYFDRDAPAFRHILNCYRDGELHVAKDICPQQFRKEMEFWGIPVHLLAPCCWRYFYESVDDIETTKVIGQNRSVDDRRFLGIENIHATPSQADSNSCSHRIWLFLEDPTSSTGAKVLCNLLHYQSC